jgi:hypothetical protein
MGIFDPTYHDICTSTFAPNAPTISAIAKDAIEIQNACNLSGIIMTWDTYRRDIWLHAREGTSAFNVHPINRLFAFKVFALSHGYEPAESISGTEDTFETAYHLCQKLAHDPDALVWDHEQQEWHEKENTHADHSEPS